MCVATWFPEAIPLRKITAKSVTKASIQFFTTFGLPKTIQTDQGSNFWSNVFKNESFKSLICRIQCLSSRVTGCFGAMASNFLKSALQKYCLETENEWDDGVPLVLFALREARQVSLVFSPSKLVFGQNVRGLLKILKDHFFCSRFVWKK